MKNKVGFYLAGSAVLGSLLVGGVAFAQMPQAPGNGFGGEGMHRHMMGGDFGTTTPNGARPERGFGPNGRRGHATSTPQTMHAPFVGNGQPVIGGNVTAVSGSSLTVTNEGNTTYTVDATNATIKKGVATSTVASIAIGDSVLVQGTVQGTAVTASSIIDHGTKPAATSTPNSATARPKGFVGHFFGAVGGFFSHIFGF